MAVIFFSQTLYVVGMVLALLPRGLFSFVILLLGLLLYLCHVLVHPGYLLRAWYGLVLTQDVDGVD
jgi:hypothetical protein